MAYNERLEEIARILQRRRRVTVPELSERFSISEVTVRKDLSLLEERGFLVRTHGGAILAEERETGDRLHMRATEYDQNKCAIAEEAARLLSDGATIILDAGSTNLALAQEVVSRNLRVVTNSLEIGYRLAGCPEINLHLVGGSLRHSAMSLIGPQALAHLANINVDIAFIGASGYSEERGFSCTNVIEGQAKEAMMRCANRTVILADSSKYGRDSFCTFARLQESDLLITDDGLAPGACVRLRERGIEVVLAAPQSERVAHVG